MTGLTAWQRVVYYLGTVLMLGGFGWAVYRMAVLHGCPTARFNDLSLIVLGLGLSILPLHPCGASATYLVPVLRRIRGVAIALWALGLAGAAYSVYALWQHIPNLQWMPALLPAALYMWFGIETGKPSASGPRAADNSGSAGFNPRAVEPTAVSAINNQSRTEPSAPLGEEKSRLEASAPSEEEQRDA